MPWLRRDWDSAAYICYQRQHVRVMPWLRRDWDPTAGFFWLKVLCSSDALTKKGLRPLLMPSCKMDECSSDALTKKGLRLLKVRFSFPRSCVGMQTRANPLIQDSLNWQIGIQTIWYPVYLTWDHYHYSRYLGNFLPRKITLGLARRIRVFSWL